MKWRNKTRGGYPVRIYAEDGKAPYPIHGAIDFSNGWVNATWTSEGAYALDGQLAERNLVPNTPTIDWPAQPAWCKAVAMVKGGSWIRLDGVPIAGMTLWLSSEGRSLFTQQMHPSESPQWGGDWAESLCVRPEGGAA